MAENSGWRWWPADREQTSVQVATSEPEGKLATVLTVYIEGDGLAWTGPTTVSGDPTPVNPLALRLAVQDAGAAAYLGRPCQFGRVPVLFECSPTAWTSHRYSREAVSELSRGLDALRKAMGANTFRLVGYSGGGVMALLLAAERDDVEQVVTVASNLDTAEWTRRMGLSPLSGSLNPADFTGRLESLPQVHWVGARDRTVPLDVTERFAARSPQDRRPDIRILDEFDHRCCWAERWPELLRATNEPKVTTGGLQWRSLRP